MARLGAVPHYSLNVFHDFCAVGMIYLKTNSCCCFCAVPLAEQNDVQMLCSHNGAVPKPQEVVRAVQGPLPRG